MKVPNNIIFLYAYVEIPIYLFGMYLYALVRAQGIDHIVEISL